MTLPKQASCIIFYFQICSDHGSQNYHLFHIWHNTNFIFDIPTMKPTAMDVTFGYVFLLFDRNNTTSYNQTGTDCKSPKTPSVFPSVQAYMHTILAFVGVVNNCLAHRGLKHMPGISFYTHLRVPTFAELLCMLCWFICELHVERLRFVFHSVFHICHILSQLMWTCAKNNTIITTSVGLAWAVSVLSPSTLIYLLYSLFPSMLVHDLANLF